jgi:predicted  nucleic acid-binding Zn-ribbon protein
MSPTRSLYGAALRLWVRSDAQRLPKIAQVVETSDLDNLDSSNAVWIPYCLAYLSHYPLFDLMSDYLRCSWMLWSKDPDKFNTQGVQRLIRLPPPKPDQFLRVTLDKYTLCYQVPSISSEFQNFALWPLFTCLSPNHIIAILDSALSQKARIIFTSYHMAVLTNVAETLRFFLGSWAGLYVPVVYGRHAQELVDEPAPYILGIPKQSRALYNAPGSALVIDLDFNRVFTSRPPGALSQRQSAKCTAELTQALGFGTVQGVPNHLRSAYEQNVRFSAFGPTLAENSALTIKEPEWWDHMRVLTAMNHICNRIRRNFKFITAWRNLGRDTQKVQKEDLAKIVHHRNNLSRSLDEAWREYIDMKRRSDMRTIAHQKSIISLHADIDKGKKDFQELSECTEQLIDEMRQLQSVINTRNKEVGRLSEQLKDKTTHAKQMTNHVAELQSELDQASKTLKVQQEMLDEIKTRSTKDALSQERDNSQRAVIHLTSLISGQMAYVERVLASLIAPSRPGSQQDLRKGKGKEVDRSPSPGTPVSPAPRLTRRMSSRRNTMDFSQQSVVTDRSNKRFSQIVREADSIEEKVKLISDTVRRINSQCFQAIEDLASQRNTKAPRVYDSSSGDEGERAVSTLSNMSSVPDLDSRAETSLSGSVAELSPHPQEGDEDAVRIQAIAEELESDIEGENFVDAAPIVDQKDTPASFERGQQVTV